MSSSKSSGRSIIKEKFPDSYFKQTHILGEQTISNIGSHFESEARPHPTVHITDVLSWFFSHGERRDKTTGSVTFAKNVRDFIRNFRELVVAPFKMGNVDHHVILFDKSIHTPCTKRVRPSFCEEVTEWSSVCTQVKEMEEIALFMEADSMISNEDYQAQLMTWGGKLPSPWTSVMKDKKRLRRWVINYAVAHILDDSKGPESEFSLRNGADLPFIKNKRLIIDGHCLSYAQVSRLTGFRELRIPGEGEQMKAFGSLDVDIQRTIMETWPLCVEFRGNNERIVTLAHEWRNDLGESDYTAFFYANKFFSCGVRAVRISSVDVDLIYNAVVNSTRLRELKDAYDKHLVSSSASASTSTSRMLPANKGDLFASQDEIESDTNKARGRKRNHGQTKRQSVRDRYSDESEDSQFYGNGHGNNDSENEGNGDETMESLLGHLQTYADDSVKNSFDVYGEYVEKTEKYYEEHLHSEFKVEKHENEECKYEKAEKERVRGGGGSETGGKKTADPVNRLADSTNLHGETRTLGPHKNAQKNAVYNRIKDMSRKFKRKERFLSMNAILTQHSYGNTSDRNRNANGNTNTKSDLDNKSKIKDDKSVARTPKNDVSSKEPFVFGKIYLVDSFPSVEEPRQKESQHTKTLRMNMRNGGVSDSEVFDDPSVVKGSNTAFTDAFFENEDRKKSKTENKNKNESGNRSESETNDKNAGWSIKTGRSRNEDDEDGGGGGLNFDVDFDTQDGKIFKGDADTIDDDMPDIFKSNNNKSKKQRENLRIKHRNGLIEDYKENLILCLDTHELSLQIERYVKDKLGSDLTSMEAVMTYISLMYMAGSDYTSGIPGIKHEGMIAAFEKCYRDEVDVNNLFKLQRKLNYARKKPESMVVNFKKGVEETKNENGRGGKFRRGNENENENENEKRKGKQKVDTNTKPTDAPTLTDLEWGIPMRHKWVDCGMISATSMVNVLMCAYNSSIRSAKYHVQNPLWSRLSFDYIARAVKNHNPNNAAVHPLTLEELTLSMLNLQYAMRMMVQTGVSKLTLPENRDLSYYGYGTDMNYSTGEAFPGFVESGNIRRMCMDAHYIAVLKKKNVARAKKEMGVKIRSALDIEARQLMEFEYEQEFGKSSLNNLKKKNKENGEENIGKKQKRSLEKSSEKTNKPQKNENDTKSRKNKTVNKKKRGNNKKHLANETETDSDIEDSDGWIKKKSKKLKKIK